METAAKFPKSLLEAVRHFTDPQVCHEFVVAMRWPGGVCCPRCGDTAVGFVKTRRIWNCHGCKKQFSVKVGTVMEDSPLGLDKWLVAIWMLTGAKNGISSCELARALGVTQKTAWFLLHRVREALQSGTFEKITGTVEADETFVGGLAKNMHADKKERINGRGGVGKTIVMGVLQRGNGAKDEFGNRRPQGERVYSRVRATIIPDTSRLTLHRVVKANVTPGAEVFTDAARGYNGLSSDYAHDFVDHAFTYVRGRVHTNGIENFWNLLDRSIHGTYIKPMPFHLRRYIDEQAFRFNHRDGTDLTRFLSAVSGTKGKRLTYRQLTGK